MYFNGKTSKLYFNKIGFKDRDIGVIGTTALWRPDGDRYHCITSSLVTPMKHNVGRLSIIRVTLDQGISVSPV